MRILFGFFGKVFLRKNEAILAFGAKNEWKMLKKQDFFV
jgi:hypothetical protein